MAHKKGVGSTDNGRDSNSKRLGVKLFGGELAIAGNIIVRQRGTKYHPGNNVGIGKDHTLYSLVDGTVAFKKGRKNRTFVHILPLEEAVWDKLSTNPKEEVENALADAPKVEPVETSVEDNTPADVMGTGNMEEPKEENVKPDDFKKIEGIGPKINELIHNAGINTFAQLAKTPAEEIKEILVAAGSRYQMHDPTTWPKQAELAAEGKWDELKKWQDELDGGKA